MDRRRPRGQGTGFGLTASRTSPSNRREPVDPYNFTTVLARHPEVRHKVHHLSALAGGEAQEMRDPFGGTVDELRRAYDRIRRALDAALAARGGSGR
ncbi:MAG TPA: hypothetical protein VNO26_07360 [Candidatus Limnocylindria bacterium]|nr:hypothetical protein [Candidatus Limnocylindria bacterium]